MSFARNFERRYMMLAICLLTAIKYVCHRIFKPDSKLDIH